MLFAGPLLFQGRELRLSEEVPPGATASKPRAATSFIPRAAGNRQRLGIGAKSKELAKTAPTSSSNAQKGQDDFRKMLG